MATFQKTSLIGSLKKRTEWLTEEVKSVVAGLDQEEMNWQPGPDKWSIAQVLYHLVTTNEPYLSSTQIALAKAQPDTRTVYKSSWLGDKMEGMLKPGPDGKIRKMPAPKSLRPTSSTLESTGILSNFLRQQQDLLTMLNSTEYVNIEGAKVPFSMTRLIKFPVCDAWRFIIAHNERHLLQMRNVKDQLHEFWKIEQSLEMQ